MSKTDPVRVAMDVAGEFEREAREEAQRVRSNLKYQELKVAMAEGAAIGALRVARRLDENS